MNAIINFSSFNGQEKAFYRQNGKLEIGKLVWKMMMMQKYQNR